MERLTDEEQRELLAMAKEFVEVGRENHRKPETPRMSPKDIITAIYQTLGIIAVLITAIVFLTRSPSETPQSTANAAAIAKVEERLRLLELKVASKIP